MKNNVLKGLLLASSLLTSVSFCACGGRDADA